MASISPICKKSKTFILALKSPTYRDFMIKIQDIKISHLGTFNGPILRLAGPEIQLCDRTSKQFVQIVQGTCTKEKECPCGTETIYPGSGSVQTSDL